MKETFRKYDGIWLNNLQSLHTESGKEKYWLANTHFIRAAFQSPIILVITPHHYLLTFFKSVSKHTSKAHASFKMINWNSSFGILQETSCQTIRIRNDRRICFCLEWWVFSGPEGVSLYITRSFHGCLFAWILIFSMVNKCWSSYTKGCSFKSFFFQWSAKICWVQFLFW